MAEAHERKESMKHISTNENTKIMGRLLQNMHLPEISFSESEIFWMLLSENYCIQT
jgi:hypothetical protein